MRFFTGVLVGLVIALSSPSIAAEAPGIPGQGDHVPGSPPPASSLAPGECSTASTSMTFTVVNKRGQVRTVTRTESPCGSGYSLVTRYRSPWTTQ